MSYEQIAKQLQSQVSQQAKATYEDYKKIKSFKDVAYLLEDYVISGGVVSKDTLRNDTVHVTDIVVSLNDNMMSREGQSFQTTVPSATYYLDFYKDGDWRWDVSHEGTANEDYIAIAAVTTDAHGLVQTITDLRGHVGGTRFKDEFGLEQYATNEQLADKAPYLSNGKLILPSDFAKIPFNIYKRKYGEWYSDATPYNQFDWSTATHVYIGAQGSSGNGLNPNNPISLSLFKANFASAVYGVQTKFVLNMVDFVYFANASASNDITIDFDADILIRAFNPSGFTWIGRIKNSNLNTQTSAWIPDSGIYKTTQTANHDVLDVVNLSAMGGEEIPSPYHKVTSLALCQATSGTFFRSATDVWVNPYTEDDVEDLCLVISTAMLRENQGNARVLMYENIGFVASAFATATGNNIEASFYYFGCKWYRATNNGFYKAGVYKAYLFNCLAVYPTLDCFNYHTTDPNSVAVEVNCFGTGAGKYKLTTGQPTHSNNGSTAHDGMYMLRVGSVYSECEGPIVADVNNCYSISIGCEASGILDSTTGVRAAYQFYDTGSTAPAKPKYVLECKGYGENVEIGVSGTDKTYVANFIGVNKMEGNIKERGEIVW